MTEMTGDEAGASVEDKPPTSINGIPERKKSTHLTPAFQQNTEMLHVTPTSSVANSSHGSMSPQSSANASPAMMNNKKAVFFAKPETDSGVALPAETAAEAEAVLQAIEADERSGDKSESDNEPDDDIVEEGRDGRWSKRKDRVKQRDVPGIDACFLAMDNETGNEVVWNEVQFSERKNFRAQEEKIRTVFDNLMQLDHVNLVKFHDWWADTKPEKPRIIFVTEYMSSGSMSKFLQRAKTSETLSNIRMWKKWTIQILSALNYLHTCDPPIAHANLSCNTIFIQQNGLIKIGCVAPNAIHHHVKTFRENLRNLHYIAPEYEYLNEVTTQADIYSFGICALEMATRGNITTECATQMNNDVLVKAVESLENSLQRDFILKCIDPDPKLRPTAKELLFHPVLFEVHSLKLLAAHVIVNTKMIDHLSEDDLRIRDSSKPAFDFHGHTYTYADMESVHACKMDLDKFLEDVKNGIYPLIAFAPLAHRPLKLLSQSPSAAVLPSSTTPKLADDHALTASASAPQNIAHQATPETNSGASNQAGARKNSTDDVLAHDSNGTTAKDELHPDNNGTTSKPSSSESHTIASALPPYVDTSSATSTITSVTGSLGSPTALEPSSTISSQGGGSEGEKPQGEMRLIKHMRAAIKDQILSLLLQFEDYMNRQLKTDITPNDQAEELATELITHGLICQEDSEKVGLLLAKVLEDYREELAQSGSKSTEKVADFENVQESPSTETAIPAPPRPPSESIPPSAMAPKAIPEDLEETSPPPSMTAPRHQ